MTKSTNISQHLNFFGDIEEAAAYLETYDHITDYAAGPINMSKQTALFIEIVKKIISKSDDLTLSYSDDHTKIIVTDKTNSNVTNLDLTGLMTKVNFTHLTLEEANPLAFTNAESAAYAVNFTEIMSQFEVPPAEADLKVLIPLDDKNTASLHNLTYGELLALRYYTKHGDKYMNTMIRNGTIYNSSDSVQTLDYHLNAIVSAAIASSALNRLPDIEIPYVIRYDNTFGLREKCALAEQDGVSEMHGFFSASLFPNMYDAHHLFPNPDQRVTTIIHNVRGKAIWPISAISGEYEYVIPPSTQIRYTGYEHSSMKPGIFIAAEGANVLMETTELLLDQIMQAKTPQEKTVIFKDYYKTDRRVEKKLLHALCRDPDLYKLIVDLDIEGLDGSLIAQLKLASNANADKFVALAVAGLRGCYDDTSEKFPTFDQLKDFDAKDITSLTSVNALSCYERDILKFIDIRQWPSEKVDAITSPIACAFLQNQDTPPEFIRLLLSCSAEKIKALTSSEAVQTYKIGVNPQNAAQYSAEEIKIITSEEARHEYAQRNGEDLDTLIKQVLLNAKAKATAAILVNHVVTSTQPDALQSRSLTPSRIENDNPPIFSPFHK